jgi:UDP-N-acetylmuramoyl-L-alanyl-D-glutamate--2,6-diaminopimelate ligase
VNLDDAGARSVLPYCGGCRRVLRYSVDGSAADLRAEIGESGLKGSRGLLHAAETTYPFSIPLVGAFNVSNSLAALGTAVAAGLEIGEAIQALATVPAIPGRMTSIDSGQPFGVVVDYAHTPESLEKVLRLLRSLRPDGRVIAVFGSAGERDAVKRPIQGRVAAEHADVAVITNEDPRFEDAEAIIREIAAGSISAGAVEGETVHCVVERRDAISLAFELARPGDTILLAGKGHERSIIWNGVKHPWDEATVARELLAERGWTG